MKIFLISAYRKYRCLICVTLDLIYFNTTTFCILKYLHKIVQFMLDFSSFYFVVN